MAASKKVMQDGFQPGKRRLCDLLNGETLFKLFHGVPVLRAEAEYVLATLNMLHGTNFTVENLDIVIQPDVTQKEINEALYTLNLVRTEMGLLEEGERYEALYRQANELYFWFLERGVTIFLDEERGIYKQKKRT